MSTFKYRLLSTYSGIIEGEKESANEKDLINELRKSGQIVLSIQKVDKDERFGFFINRVNKKAVLPFTQELATLLEGGIPIDKGLSILVAAQSNATLKNIIEDLLNAVKSGKSLAESLSTHSRLFSGVYVNMIRAGEEGGVLAQVLKRLGAYHEKLQKVRGEIISAMIYPVLLSFTGVLSMGALIVYVIPKFSEIFEGMGISLPFSTMVLMGVSRFSIRYGWIVAFVIAIIVIIYRRAKKDRNASIRMDQRKLKLPLIGSLLWKMQIARFARTLGTLLENGVPLLKSMDIVKDVLSNTYLADILGNVKADVKGGASLTVSLAKKGFLPEFAVHLLKVGEETGSLDKMLLRVADNFDNEVEQRLKRLVTMVEPMLILLMGGVIGLIVVSMLTAIMSVNEMRF